MAPTRPANSAEPRREFAFLPWIKAKLPDTVIMSTMNGLKVVHDKGYKGLDGHHWNTKTPFPLQKRKWERSWLYRGGRKREGERSERLQRHRDRRRGRYLSGGHLPLTTKWTLYSFNFRAVLWAWSESRMRTIQRHFVSSGISIATLL